MPTEPTTTALAAREETTLPIARQVFGDERIQVLKDIVAKGCTDAELEAFALVCQRTKLDPFARPPQIYAIKRWDSKLGREVLTPQASIDSFRLVAARTREYQGQLGPFWCGPDGEWKDVWLSPDPPTAARVGVLRKGFREPIWSVAVWQRAAQYADEYRGGSKTGNRVLAPFWQRMGPEMLAKTAECNALKRGFPNDTEGLELAAIDAELRAAAPTLAAKYDRIYGADEEHAFAELPRPRERDLVTTVEGHLVDRESGEVLDDDEEHVSQEPPPPTAQQKVAQLQVLLAEAKKRKLQGEPQLADGADQDPIDAAIAYWERRIENHDHDQQAARESREELR